MVSYVFEFTGKYAKLLDLANLPLNKFPTYTLLNEYLAALSSADCVVVIVVKTIAKTI